MLTFLGRFLSRIRIGWSINRLFFYTFLYLSERDLKILSKSELLNTNTYRKMEKSLDSVDRGYFKHNWTLLTSLAVEGQFHDSIKKRIKIIEEARQQVGLSKHFIAPFMERAFTANFGHLAVLKSFSDGQKLSIIDPAKRLVLSAKKFKRDRPIIRTLQEDFEFLETFSPETLLEIEPYFALSEKVSLIQTYQGYLDTRQLLNQVAESLLEAGEAPGKILFRQNEIDEFNDLILSAGLDPSQWFVVVHNRAARDKYSVRNTSWLNFQDSIHWIVAQGGFIIRIGESDFPKKEEGKYIIDLTQSSQEKKFLQDIALMNCRFLLSSQSGPVHVAHVFGVPALQIDSVAIGCSTYSTVAPSLYLPKKWVDNRGRELPWTELFERNLIFTEKSLPGQGLFLKPTSSHEILESVVEFNAMLRTPNLLRRNPKAFDEAKAKAGGVGKGLLSNSFFS